MSLKTVIISQARMGSTRLPGKVLKKILDKTVLEYHLERLHAVPGVDLVGVATTVEKRDDAIAEFCEQRAIPYFRGSEHDVLSRYFGAAKKWHADIVVRVTSDTPLLEPEVVARLIQAVRDDRNCDYAANFHHDARTFPIGMEAEVMTFAALARATTESSDPGEREHVTPFIWKRPEIFNLRIFGYPQNLSHLRWTVDTPEDFTVITNILTDLYPRKKDFRIPDVLEVLSKHPQWAAINADIHHKYLPLSVEKIVPEIMEYK